MLHTFNTFFFTFDKLLSSETAKDGKEGKDSTPGHPAVGGEPESARKNNSTGIYSAQTSFTNKRPSIIDSIVYDSAAIPRYGLVHGVRGTARGLCHVFVLCMCFLKEQYVTLCVH